MPFSVRLFYVNTKIVVENITVTGQTIEFSMFLYQVIEILYCTKTANYFQFRAQHCQKYASHQKYLQIKVVWN